MIATDSAAEAHMTPAVARIAVAAIFFVNGFVFATWVPQIPAVQAQLGLGHGLLGLALLGMPLGAVFSMPVAGWLTLRWGCRPIMLASSTLYCLFAVLPLMASDVLTLTAALVVLGAANGGMDVSMNAQGVLVERRMGRPVMSSLHAQFSIGALLGASATIPATQAGLPPFAQVGGGALLGLVLVLASWRFHLRGTVGGSIGGPGFALPRGPLLLYGSLGFLVLLCEGAAADWGAVYLSRNLDADPALSGAAYAAFALSMAAGRLAGDRLVAAAGAGFVVVSGAWLAVAGFGGGLLANHPAAAIAGFACLGLGVANIVPVLFSAAGRLPGVSPGVGIAAMTTAGYGGFLAGPALIGFIAEGIGLPAALGVMVGALALVGATARRLHLNAPQA